MGRGQWLHSSSYFIALPYTVHPGLVLRWKQALFYQDLYPPLLEVFTEREDSCRLAFLGICLYWNGNSWSHTGSVFIYLWWALPIWWPHVDCGWLFGEDSSLFQSPCKLVIHSENGNHISVWPYDSLPPSLPWILCCFVLCHQESSKAFASFFIHYALFL